jgi:hypothetical protein
LSPLKNAVTKGLGRVIEPRANTAERLNHLAATNVKVEIKPSNPLLSGDSPTLLPHDSANYGADIGLGLVGSLYPSRSEQQALHQTRQLLLDQGMPLSPGKTGLVTVGEILDSSSIRTPAQLAQQAEREVRAAWCERILLDDTHRPEMEHFIADGMDASTIAVRLQASMGGNTRRLMDAPASLIEARALQLANQQCGILRPDQQTLELNQACIDTLLLAQAQPDVRLLNNLANLARKEDHTPLTRTVRQAAIILVERQMAQ